MNRTLKILGIIVLMLITGAGMLACYASYVSDELDESSRVYVDQFILGLSHDWKPEHVLNRASPELLQSRASNLNMDPVNSGLSSAVSSLKALGEIKHYDGASGDAEFIIRTNNRLGAFASYSGHATFEHGEVAFTIELIKVAGEWKLLSLYFDNVPLSFSIEGRMK